MPLMIPPVNLGNVFEYQIRPRYELRARAEWRQDADFDDSSSDDKALFLARARAGFDVQSGPDSEFRFVLQGTYDDLRTDSGPDSRDGDVEVSEAFLTRAQGGSRLTLGRQKVNLGAQRLIGALEWANSGRSWDGARLSNDTWDLFYGFLAINSKPNRDVELLMAAYDWSAGESAFLVKRDRDMLGADEIATLNHRFTGASGSIRYELEGAYQFGRGTKGEMDAFAFIGRASHSIGDFRIWLEGDVASGGSSGSKSRTFDNLYPTNHLFYGAADLQGLSNLKAVSAGVNWQAAEDLTFAASFHNFELYCNEDGWYGAAGGLNSGPGGPFIDPTGSSGSSIGREIDVILTWTPATDWSIQGGIAFFDPGSFVDSILGYRGDRQIWSYLQVSGRF